MASNRAQLWRICALFFQNRVQLWRVCAVFFKISQFACTCKDFQGDQPHVIAAFSKCLLKNHFPYIINLFLPWEEKPDVKEGSRPLRNNGTNMYAKTRVPGNAIENRATLLIKS